MSFDHMRIVKAESASPIDLGRWDEKNVTRVEFNLTPYINLYGEGVPQLTVKKPGDPLEYAAPVEREGNVAVWVVGREWLTKDGQGKCQLFWHVTETGGVAKSPEYKLKVSEAMGMSSETAKEPHAGYLAQVQAAGVQAQEGARRAEAASGTAVAKAKETADEAVRAVNAAEDAGKARSDAQNHASAAQEAAQTAGRDAQTAQTRADDAERAARLAEGYTSHPPIIGENDNWWEWGGTTYADTGKPCRGEQGPKGDTGPQGEQGIQGEKGENSVVVVAVVEDDVLRLSEVGSSEIVAAVENDILHVGKEVMV